MNNFKYSSKMRLLAVISAVLIVLGMTLGTVMHFLGNGFYNFGGEYSGSKSVTVTYMLTEFKNDEEVEEICFKAFDNAQVAGYTKAYGSTSVGRQLTFKFPLSTDGDKLQTAVDSINTQIESVTSEFTDIPQSRAVWHTDNALLGGEFVLTRSAIALAVVVAVHFIYTLIRYGLAAMATAFFADLHNLALYAALLALCRVPVTSSVMVIGLLLLLVTVVGVTLTLDRIKRNVKSDDYAKNTIAEISDLSAAQTLKTNAAMPIFLAAAALIAFGLMAISAMSVTVVLAPAAAALTAFVVCGYGNTLFVPSIYPAINMLCGKIAAPSQKKGK